MNYWRLKCVGGDSCEETLNKFIDGATNISGDITELRADLKSQFNELVNMMLYINSGNPDVREFNTGKTFFERSKKAANKKKNKIKPYTVVGFSFKKETFVAPFFRWQAYGPKHSLRRYQLIDGYTKGGL